MDSGPIEKLCRLKQIHRDVEPYIGAENEPVDTLVSWVIELADIGLDWYNQVLSLTETVERLRGEKRTEYGKLREENEALREALKLNMDWIGAPPADRYSFDSLREEAWKKGQAALHPIPKGDQP